MDERQYVLRWLSAFLFTATLEIPIVVALLRQTGKPLARRFAMALTAQVASHPAVWFVFPALGMSYWKMIVVAECWAVLSETAIYFGLTEGLRLRRAFFVSLLANSVSYGLGLLSQRVWEWPG